MTLLVQVEDETGRSRSNFFINVSEMTKFRYNKAQYATSRLLVGQNVEIKTPHWSLMNQNRPGHVVSMTDWNRDGLKFPTSMSLLQKHIFLFSDNPSNLGNSFKKTFNPLNKFLFHKKIVYRNIFFKFILF
jgi:hypothetical protein